MDIYNRQKKLDLYIPETVAVIGIGGVGSWVALQFALTGVERIILIDNDIIEDSNLNRTPFTLNQVNQFKVNAMSELIIKRRINCGVYPVASRFEEISDCVFNVMPDPDVVVDCRDTTKPLKRWADKCIITGGYNGSNITIHVKPDYSKIWGSDRVRYSVTPSWLIPPVFIASIIVSFICFKLDIKETIKTFDLKNFIMEVLNG